MPVRLSVRHAIHLPNHSFIQFPLTLTKYFNISTHERSYYYSLPYSHAELIKYTFDVLNQSHTTQKFRIVAMLLKVAYFIQND
jgi:hypothetical protein